MKYLHWILFLLLTAIYTAMYMDSLTHIPVYHEQHHLFLFGKDYLLKHLHYPGGMLDYLTDFFIQFLYIPWGRNLFFALFLSLPYLLNALTVKNITKHTDIFSVALIPSLYLFIGHESIDFSLHYAVGLNLCLFMYYLLSLFKGRSKYYLLLFVMAGLGTGLGWLYPAVSLFIVAFPCLSSLLPNKYIKGKWKVTLLFSMLLLYAVSSFTFFVRAYNMPEHLILQAEKNVKEENWEKVLIYCNRYRGENQLIYYFRNMALFHLGRLPYELLNAPPNKFGVQALYLPWKSDGRQSEYGHYIYEQLGYLNEAHRWVFESMTVMGETPSALVNLIRYNMANQRQEVSMRFIRVLKKSLFYKKEAVMYEGMIKKGEELKIKMLTHDEKEGIRFANVLNLGPELEYLCERDPSDRMAFEYLMSHLLLSNKIPRFVNNLGRIRNFSYPQMPVLYEEALLLYKIAVDENIFNKLGFTIRKDTEDRFNVYFKLYKEGNTEELKRKFSNTYWFYMNFISPYGDKISED